MGKYSLNLGWFALLGILLTAGPAFAECEPEVAQLVSLQGRVEVKRLGQQRWEAATENQVFCAGDSLTIGANSQAGVRFSGKQPLSLDQHTTILFPQNREEASSWLELLRGALYYFGREPQRLQVRTPFANAGPKGTEFLIRVDPKETTVSVFEGRAVLSNAAGSLTLDSGQTGVAERGKVPVLRIVVRPRDAVQWAFYYPPIIDARAKRYRPGPAAQALEAVLARYRRNDLQGAFAALEAVPDKLRDARYFTLRAQLFLLVGRVEEARPAIDQALKRHPANGDAVALQAIIAMVQNDKEQALRLAEKAIQLDPQSPVPWIGLSFVQQAHFTIDEALASVQEALRLNPEDALAWSRLAELQLSRGELDQALESAQQAVTLNPQLARTQSVLGFVYLTRIEVAKAKTAFDEAIRLDQADPLPRLGMGLAKIRQGDLEGGREEIEIATSLDPSNSLIRSYLGKAYFEEKHGKLAADQFTMAKELDPKDPTPWFYDAIRKQTENQPVEALHDLQKSIELNDNRAVYRSQLLLDEDRAIRGTSLARIYDDLGFEQLAQIEATKSLNINPADYSAHRFLSDSYVTLPRHEIARVSELLQAQLLQPININPVQPSLAETRLNIITSASPAGAAFNEFTPLFERDQTQLIASGTVGNNDTLSDEVVLSGIQGPLSYSLGQFHYETEGFRQNADLQHDIYNVFAQFALSPELNLQAEYRHRETDQGDLRLNFAREAANPKLRSEVNQDTFRLGGRISLSPGSDLVASWIYNDFKGSLGPQISRNLDFPLITSETVARAEAEGYQVELQYLSRGAHHNLTLGAGSYRIDRTGQDQTNVVIPGFGVFPSPPSRSESSPKNDNAYLYTSFAFPSPLTWTLGLSYDDLEEERLEVDEFNPKLGLQWDLTNALRLRLAAFQIIKRTLVVNQTIEPTQVAGFNQFFDDPNGTKAKRYGIGLDTRLTDELYGGLEISQRDLEVPILGEPVLFEDWQEDLYRGYLYWTPLPDWVLSTGFELERFERESSDNRPESVETLSLPLAVHYFDPSGLFAGLSATYVHQEVDRPVGTAEGSEDFTVLDGSIGYRLPKRRGLIGLEALNLFDESFRFQDDGFRSSIQSGPASSPRLIPERQLLFRVTLNF